MPFSCHPSSSTSSTSAGNIPSFLPLFLITPTSPHSYFSTSSLFFLFYYIRTLRDLAVANIIQYETATHQIQPLSEANIMTRHMIKFKSMVLMMKLPKDCDIPTLFKELSACEEMLKPLRRTEKVLLNGFAKIIRYPIKAKVIQVIAHQKNTILVCCGYLN
jgi:hypothetical protein